MKKQQESWEKDWLSWARFIELKPYFRKIPEKEYQELKDFIAQERRKAQMEIIEKIKDKFVEIAIQGESDNDIEKGILLYGRFLTYLKAELERE